MFMRTIEFCRISIGCLKQNYALQHLEIKIMMDVYQIVLANTSPNYNYTPGIYADGYIVFAFPFVRLLVRSYFRHVRGICVKVLRQSFSSCVYLSNYISETIQIWTVVQLDVNSRVQHPVALFLHHVALFVSCYAPCPFCLVVPFINVGIQHNVY